MSEPEGRLRILFRVFFSLSAVTLGGGIAMLPLISREFVEKRRWLSQEDMLDTVAIMQAMPGIIAMNMGVLIGHRCAGWRGALVALSASLLPPFLAIVLLATLIMAIQGTAAAQQAFLGVRAAVCGLILIAVLKLARPVLRDWFTIVVAAGCFVALVFFNLNAIWLIIGGALAGLLQSAVSLWRRRSRKAEGGQA
ncbi:MAG: chromate transporter [Oligosphaeraceae bacterium]|nr:chromate transporter [Oligosphaeraceae bacterium]